MDRPRASAAGFIIFAGFLASIVIGALVWWTVEMYITDILFVEPDGARRHVPGLLGLAAGLVVWVPMMTLGLMEWNREHLSWAGPPRGGRARTSVVEEN